MSAEYSFFFPSNVTITDAKKNRFSSGIQDGGIINQTMEDLSVSGNTITIRFSDYLTQEEILFIDTLKVNCVTTEPESIDIIKPSHNETASREPTIYDDKSRNYDTTSRWKYNGVSWVCVDNSIENAVWKQIQLQGDTLEVINNGDVQYTLPNTIGVDNQILAVEEGVLLFKHAKHAMNTIVYTGPDILNIEVDPTEATVLFSDGGSYPVNTIRAISNDDDLTIDILTHSVDHYLYRNIPVSSITIGSIPISSALAGAVNELNSLFTQTASISGSPPSITSSLNVTISEGETLNYELTSSYGVGYEWVTLPTGVVVSTMNRRKLLGGSQLLPGDHQITVKAINYYGCDEQTITLTVTPLPYSNTRSIRFDNHEYLESDIGVESLTNTLGRLSNGIGSSDAWSVSIYFKPGTSSKSKQTIFYYGTSDKHDSHLFIRYVGTNDYKNILVHYGSYHNYLQFTPPINSVSDTNKWYHILLTYDGGVTGSASDQVDSYYNAFRLYIDGVLQTTTNSHENYGVSYGFNHDDMKLRIGRYYNSDYMHDNCKVDEIAIWDSDQSSNIVGIYNGGVTHTLTVLTPPPVSWWRMGDGDVYPFVKDNVSDVDLTMYNMTIDGITTDAP